MTLSESPVPPSIFSCSSAVAMFRLELADDLAVLQMPMHRASVEEAVQEKGLSEWCNASERGKSPTRNVPMVELLCSHPGWVRKQWQYHNISGTKLQIQELNTKPPKMMDNAARVEFLQNTDLIVRAVLEKLGADPAPTDLTLETVLPPGDYFYIIMLAGLMIFKGGHFLSNRETKPDGQITGRDHVYERYEDHAPPGGLEPHEVALWRRDNLSLYALVEGVSKEDEQAIHAELRTTAKDMKKQRYRQCPVAVEIHDIRLLDAALRLMGKYGVVRIARTPAVPADDVHDDGHDDGHGDEAEKQTAQLSKQYKYKVITQLNTGVLKQKTGPPKELSTSQIREKGDLLRLHFEAGKPR